MGKNKLSIYDYIFGTLTLLLFIYALYIVPKAVGEIKGIYMETPNPFFGKFKEDCKWTHGTTYSLGALSYVVLIPLLILIYEQTMIHLGEPIAIIFICVILILTRQYYIKQKVINAKKAHEKNIEEGLIKKDTPLPDMDGRLTKIIKKHKKRK